MPTAVSRLRWLFLGPDGLRAGWRFLAFLVLWLLVDNGLRWAVLTATRYTPPPGFDPKDLLIADTLMAISVLAVSWALVRAERRGTAWFGLPLRGAFGSLFWEGVLWGALLVSALFAAAWVGGGVGVSGFAVHGAELARMAVLWIAAMAMVGLAEESLFRGYPFVVLARGLGFWPAAWLLSLLFGADHYFFKPMETVADGLSVTLLGLFCCFTLLRTGQLWFAIGFHAAFDFFALGLYGAPNTGNSGKALPGHLLDTHFAGPTWLTGGPQGLEASWLIFPLLALMAWAFHRRYPRAWLEALPQRAAASPVMASGETLP
ncbi:MAG: CPBP family intramembrane glutamic endopeptidase [Mizugakiibacter sp.]|uniref:CPBP family intramembrane glutamic endopeptidase n=1 Tax=Mizugakiibacter sp. TaxID=1972610 RepID=UPI0031C1AEE5|nr:CPBP family intramembrane metalloprotease [Xanthomonadaceae bacterium]